MTKAKPIGAPCPHHGSPLFLKNDDDEYLTCHSCGGTDYTPLPAEEVDDDF